MMGFFDKVKKALGSKNKNVKSIDSDENSVTDELIDKPTFAQSIENDNGNFNDNEEIKSEDSEETPVNVEIIDNPTPNEKNRNFRYLDELIHSGVKEIVLDSDIVLGSDEESHYLDGIKLDVDDLAIDGDGHAIDAQGLTRIFYCTGKNVTIKNIILKNGFAEKKGGAIYSIGELTITGSTFQNNASKSDGGAIYYNNMYNLELSIIGSIFQSNVSKGDGGAVYYHNNMYDLELSITRSIFQSNVSKGDGGAIYSYHAKLIFTELILKDNTAHSGGAIYVEQGALHIIGPTFQSNVSKGDGGAIYNKWANLSIKKSEFINNIALSGGAIYNNGDLCIDKSTFTDNSSEGRGGAIYNDGAKLTITESILTVKKGNGGAIYNDGDLSINYLTFDGDEEKDIFNNGRIFCKENISKKLSIHNHILGGIYELNSLKNNQRDFSYLNDLINSEVNEIKLENDIILNIRNNEDEKFNNGIKIDRNDLIIDGNGHIIDAQGLTRIFNCTGKNITIKNIILKNGFTKKDGGSIFNSGELTITESTLLCNIARGAGGAIYNDNQGELIITGSSLHENHASDGGLIFNGGASFKIFDCEVSNNSSFNLFESSIIHNINLLECYNTQFYNNQSNNIFLNNDKSNLGVYYSEFVDNNIAKGMIINMGKSCTVEKSIFDNNLSEDNSKNIINHTNLTLIDPKIKDEFETILNEGYILIRNSSQNILSKICGEGRTEVDRDIIPDMNKFDFGYLDNKIHESVTKEIKLEEDICFEDYELYFYEGGIELDIDNLIIDGNGKTIDGTNKSRIFIITGKNITLKNIIFKNGHMHKKYKNSSNNNGGAIKIIHNASLIVENCEFINNTSEETAGAIINRGELALTKTTFTNNSAEKDCGVIYNDNAVLTITESTFDNNSSDGVGGAICNNSELTITESSFNSNSTKRGGAIYNEGVLTILKSVLQENIVIDRNYGHGGAIYNLGLLKIFNSSLNRNTAVGYYSYGGATDNGGVLSITKSTFQGNKSNKSGGAISNSGELLITQSIFQDNISEGYDFAFDYYGKGGAIYNDSGVLSVTETSFIKNKAGICGGALNLENSTKYESENCNFKDNEPDDVYEEK